jgi:hypothetical protein
MPVSKSRIPFYGVQGGSMDEDVLCRKGRIFWKLRHDSLWCLICQASTGD